MMIKKFFKAIYFIHAGIILGILMMFCYLLIVTSNLLRINRFNKQIYKFAQTIKTQLVPGLFYFIFSGPIVISYDTRFLVYNKLIFIANHFSEYDWLFYLILCSHFSKDINPKIVMKSELSNIPIIGRLFKFIGDIFLTRDNRGEDILSLKKASMELSENDCFTLLIFPEGTYLCEETLNSSIEYARNKHVKFNNYRYEPRNTLIPREAGFSIIIENSKAECICDLTVFTNPYVFFDIAEENFLNFLFNEKSNFTAFIRIDTKPTSELESNFLFNSFAIKDKLFQEYLEKYTKNKISENEVKDFLKRVYHDDVSEKYQRIEIINFPKSFTYTIITIFTFLYCMMFYFILI